MARMVLSVAMLIIFVVALVIINNAMVMATLQRVQEIGTLRAVGAQRRFILGMLVIEAMVIGAIFGSAGRVLVGAGIVGLLGQVGIPAFSDVWTFFFSGPAPASRPGHRQPDRWRWSSCWWSARSPASTRPGWRCGSAPRQAMQTEE